MDCAEHTRAGLTDGELQELVADLRASGAVVRVVGAEGAAGVPATCLVVPSPVAGGWDVRVGPAPPPMGPEPPPRQVPHPERIGKVMAYTAVGEGVGLLGGVVAGGVLTVACGAALYDSHASNVCVLGVVAGAPVGLVVGSAIGAAKGAPQAKGAAVAGALLGTVATLAVTTAGLESTSALGDWAVPIAITTFAAPVLGAGIAVAIDGP